jgi:hypothetical protein
VANSNGGGTGAGSGTGTGTGPPPDSRPPVLKRTGKAKQRAKKAALSAGCDERSTLRASAKLKGANRERGQPEVRPGLGAQAHADVYAFWRGARGSHRDRAEARPVEAQV